MKAISLEDAARYTGLSAQTLKIQADRGRLGARRVGRTWTTTIEDVMRYVVSRRINASDVAVICHDCELVFLTPSEAPAIRPASGPAVLCCPRCGSAAWGIAAVPGDAGPGHRLGAALHAAVNDAQQTGSGEAEVNDATGAYVRIRVRGRAAQQIEFDVDRGGVFDGRDVGRLADHIRTALGPAHLTAGPTPIHRYEFERD